VTTNDFIFSNRPKVRLLRHFAFWVMFSLHLFMADLYTPDPAELLHSRLYLRSLINLLFFLPVAIYSAYAIIYLLLPLFLFNRKYVRFSLSLIFLCLSTFTICYYLGSLFLRILSKPPFSEDMMSSSNWEFATSNGLWLVLVVGGFAASIKLTKKLYARERETQELARQKINNELQLLKGQIHPRFLFKSLNTIHDHILSNSGHSAELLLKLSDLLSYITYESENERVPLKNELSALKEYIALEKEGFSDTFETSVRILGNTTHHKITPLLLFPFVENSFEYFDVNRLDRLSLQMSVTIKENLLLFNLVTNHGPRKDSLLDQLRLENTVKRLESMYPGRYRFETKQGPNHFTLLLMLTLDPDDSSREKITSYLRNDDEY
jgi:hypothetical protein